MIGPIKTGTLNTAEISAVIHQGLTIKLKDGKPGRLAIIDESGNIIDDTPDVSREVWNVSIASYKNMLIGKGHIRVISHPTNAIADKDKAA